MIKRWDATPFEQACIWAGFLGSIWLGCYFHGVIVETATHTKDTAIAISARARPKAVHRIHRLETMVPANIESVASIPNKTIEGSAIILVSLVAY